MKLHLLKHFHTVNKHKFYVFCYACKLGIPWRGFIHDYSKFSYTEFMNSSKYYLGYKSPTIEERNFKDGVSEICIHHTGRNKHHWQYWVDWTNHNTIIARIPYKYALEYAADIISASKVYHPKDFKLMDAYEYFKEHSKHYLMHPASREFILWVVKEANDKGWKYVKKKYTKKAFAEISAKYPPSIIIPLASFPYEYLEMK